MTGTDTRTAILDAAEEQFALHGFAATSLRAITKAAGVNVAAVNYHFRSKLGLMFAVIDRRLAPIQHERLVRLEAAEAEAGGAPVPVQTVLRAFVAPAIELAWRSRAELRYLARLLGSLWAEPDREVQRTLKEMFAPLFHRFVGALSKALPGLPQEELYLRKHFAIGVFTHTMMNLDLLWGPPDDGCSLPVAPGPLIDRMVQFMTAGVSAPFDPSMASAGLENADATRLPADAAPDAPLTPSGRSSVVRPADPGSRPDTTPPDPRD